MRKLQNRETKAKNLRRLQEKSETQAKTGISYTCNSISNECSNNAYVYDDTEFTVFDSHVWTFSEFVVDALIK